MPGKSYTESMYESSYQYTYQTTRPGSSDHVIVVGRGGGGGFTGVSIRYAFFPLLGAGGALVDTPARPADERCMTRPPSLYLLVGVPFLRGGVCVMLRACRARL